MEQYKTHSHICTSVHLYKYMLVYLHDVWSWLITMLVVEILMDSVVLSVAPIPLDAMGFPLGATFVPLGVAVVPLEVTVVPLSVTVALLLGITAIAVIGVVDPPSSGVRSRLTRLLSKGIILEGDRRLIGVWERLTDASDLFRTSSLYTGEKVSAPLPESLISGDGRGSGGAPPPPPPQ